MVVAWRVAAALGNDASPWALVAKSTWGKPLTVYDERRYFAVS